MNRHLPPTPTFEVRRVIATSGVEYHRGWEFDGEGTSYVAGALVEWDVFDGFRTSGKKAEAAALERAARQEQRRLKNAVSLEQTQSRLSEQEASERLRVTDKAITQARESVQLIRARYEQGLALTTQLIDAQAALTGAEVRRAEAMADQRIAAAAMRKAYGLPIVTEGEKP